MKYRAKIMTLGVVCAALILFVVFITALTVVPRGEATHADGVHVHDDVTFSAWNSSNSLPNADGNYYLTVDVDITTSWIITSGTIKICLNGHRISVKNIVSVDNGASLYIYDCDNTTRYYYINNELSGELASGADDPDYIAATTKGTFKGGYLTTSEHNTNSLIVVHGTFYMYSGTVFAGVGHHGGAYGADAAVCVWNGGVFYMYGGSIIGNYGNQGGGVKLYSGDPGGSFTMRGGLITHNYYKSEQVNGQGAGVHVFPGAIIDVGGDAKVVDNYSDAGVMDNLYLNTNATITSVGVFGDDARIGVSMMTPGVFTGTLSDEVDITHFYSDDLSYVVRRNDLNKACLAPLVAVTFNSNGGSAVDGQDIVAGETAEEPSDPTLTGYDFVSWCSDPELETEFDFDTPITVATTLYAKWTLATPTVVTAAGYAGTYDGQNHNLSITLTHELDGAVTYHYQWKKNGADIGGATASTYPVKSCAESNTYSVTYWATLSEETSETATHNNIVVNIEQRPITVNYTSGAKYATYHDKASWDVLSNDMNPNDQYIVIDNKVASESLYEILRIDLLGEDGLYVYADRHFYDMEYLETGTFNLKAFLYSPNYVLTAPMEFGEDAKLIVRPWTITVTPTGTFTKTYGEADGALGYILSDAAPADPLAVDPTPEVIVINGGNVAREPGENVGAYAITLGTLGFTDDDINANYELLVVEQNYIITAKEITVSGIAVNNKTYDGTTDASFVYTEVTFSTNYDGNDLTVIATGAFDTKDAGSDKTVAISGLTLTGTAANNYVLAAVGQQATATASITAKTIGIAWAHLDDLVYNGSAQKPTATATGVINGDVVTLTVSGEKTEAGTYTATAAFAEAQTNYVLPANTSATFVIRAASIEGITEEEPGEETVVIEIAGEGGFDPNAELVVRKVKSYEEEYKGVTPYVGKNEKIVAVYDVQMVLGGQKTVLEGEVTVRMLIPSSLRGKDFAIINVSGDSEERPNYTVDGDYIVITTTKLDSFAFVSEKDVDLLWLIIVLAVLLAAGLVLAAFLLLRNKKRNGKVFGFVPLFLLAAVPSGQMAAIIVLAVLDVVVYAFDIFLCLRGKKAKDK